MWSLIMITLDKVRVKTTRKNRVNGFSFMRWYLKKITSIAGDGDGVLYDRSVFSLKCKKLF